MYVFSLLIKKINCNEIIILQNVRALMECISGPHYFFICFQINVGSEKIKTFLLYNSNPNYMDPSVRT